jgi:hypothetical protein
MGIIIYRVAVYNCGMGDSATYFVAIEPCSRDELGNSKMFKPDSMASYTESYTASLAASSFSFTACSLETKPKLAQKL